jgi:REP element-mobilizing transposase RayT
MPRRRLIGSGGIVFHVMNRSAKQLPLFESDPDYQRFLDVLVEAESRYDMRLLEYCVMPNHFHLLLWPRRDDDLARYLRWVTGVHGQRWRGDRGTQGKGAVYQGRYRWVAVQDDIHLDAVRRYIVQNPVRAGLVRDVYLWPWSSAGVLDVGRRPTVTEIAGPAPLNHELDAVVARCITDGLSARRTFGSAQWRHSLEVEMVLAAALGDCPTGKRT